MSWPFTISKCKHSQPPSLGCTPRGSCKNTRGVLNHVLKRVSYKASGRGVSGRGVLREEVFLEEVLRRAIRRYFAGRSTAFW